MNELNSTKRFSDRVENYIKYRPTYPESVFLFLKERFRLNSSSVVADVGSGTGISTGPLLEIGCTVFGVEPNLEMREAAEKVFCGNPDFRSVNGTAEATNLKPDSIDLILAAQAFHWFKPAEARKEFQRILKPDRSVVLMWNERLETGSPFLETYEQLLLKYGTDYKQVRRQNTKESGALNLLFGRKGYETKTFKHSQYFNFDGLQGRLLSSSYAPNEAHPSHIPMLEELRLVFEKYCKEGIVEMPYETNLFFGEM